MARQTSVTEADLEFMLIDEDAKPKPLPYSLLEKITNGFSGAHIIGYGGSADVYEVIRVWTFTTVTIIIIFDVKTARFISLIFSRIMPHHINGYRVIK